MFESPGFRAVGISAGLQQHGRNLQGTGESRQGLGPREGHWSEMVATSSCSAQALKYYHMAIQCNPRFAQTLNNLGLVLSGLWKHSTVPRPSGFVLRCGLHHVGKAD